MKAILVLALALVSTSAFARTDTTSLTCRQATGLVAEKGAVVLSTGSPDLYDRFVANSSYCALGEVAVAAFVETLDNPSCNIGYACEARTDGQASAKQYPSKILACKEGAPGYTYTYENDHEVAHPTVCRNGKYVRVDGYTDPAPAYRTCKDGERFISRDGGGDAGPLTTKIFVCKDGKFRQLYAN